MTDGPLLNEHDPAAPEQARCLGLGHILDFGIVHARSCSQLLRLFARLGRLDEPHLGAIALAGSQFVDASVSAGSVSEALGQFADDFLKSRDARRAFGVLIVLFTEGAGVAGKE